VIRRTVYEALRAAVPGFELVSVIHPRATIAPGVQLGAGTLVLAGAIINVGCVVGENCIVNTRASLDHDSELRSYASILPGVTTGGNVVVGECSCLCIGVTVGHKVTIGAHTVVGAGAVVLKDLPPLSLAYGVPARVVRSRTPGQRHF
jgi:sugar O-acyltransferase (sialic acid O-acetyltransferase NeuD family)